MRLWIAAALAALSLPSIVEAKKAPPPSAAIEGQTVHKPIAEGGLPYLLFIPKGYNQSGSERWPLVIFLHGSGEPGTDIEVVKKHGPPMLVEKECRLPVHSHLAAATGADRTCGQVLADPAAGCPSRSRAEDLAHRPVTRLPDGTEPRGGIATWHWGTAHPERFAALAPVAAFGDPANACKAKDVPVWAFHGDHDDAVDTRGDFEMVDALKRCGSNPAPRLTVYANTDHWSWVPAYNDPALWMWMLEQRKSPAAAKPTRR